MSIAHYLKAHDKDLGGGFTVRRLLPAAAMQSVGPFIFFDHFGPIDADAAANHDVRPHPHIGLATVTYLYEGAMMHRDSVGSVQRIEPGAVNWMTAGSGIVHSERTPADLLGKPRRSHGLQLWAALPQAHEEVAPSFSHTPAVDIPTVALDGASVRVLIGSAFGRSSPVPTFSETLYLDIALEDCAEVLLTDLPQQAALYVVQGTLLVDGAALAPATMAVLEEGRAAGSSTRLRAVGSVKLVVIGGAPLDGPRYIFWNFVSSSKERLAQAADDWEQQRYAMVPGETEFIPLPKMVAKPLR
ncbi:pirin family protein [Massilia sp. PWRC2]|uniref:pirin family protein n=1 Tax=Massilia sp. PWRC2 TaxID=2804626 RepID=UPI003CF33628